jgi:hypothetical protein
MSVSIFLSSLPSPGAYARAWRKVKALPANVSVRDPMAGHGVEAGVLLEQMSRALDNRINRRGGLSCAGWDRWSDLVHDARVINDSKRRIRWSGRNLLCDARLARRYPDIHNPCND